MKCLEPIWEDFKVEVADAIQEIISGDREELRHTTIPTWLAIKILTKDLGYEIGRDKDDEIISTNGWQVDYWMRFYHKTLPTLILSGCVHDGTATLTLNDEQDDT